MFLMIRFRAMILRPSFLRFSSEIRRISYFRLSQLTLKSSSMRKKSFVSCLSQGTKKKPLTSLTVLFFMMGFITCLNDILVPYLKVVFQLDYGQAALVQFCFFGAYGLTSIPASKIIEKIGYQKGMVLGFIVTAFGCLLFYPAVSLHTYGLFLFALFILAAGIVLLQVAANPYVSVIGPKETASSRLTMVQAFNSFGTFLAPFFGAYFILSKLDQTTNAEGVKYPYLFIAAVLIVIAILLSRLHLPEIKSEEKSHSTWKKVFKEPG